MFDKKLDFLMELTNMSNVTLGNEIKMNAAHISRLRNGKRKLPRKPVFLEQMALSIASRLNNEEQKKELLGVMPYEEDEFYNTDKMSLRIVEWFKDEDSSESIVNAYKFMDLRMQNSERQDEILLENEQEINENDFFYYGIEGKREAVLRLLTEIMYSESPQTLLLCSDENTSWLNDSGDFEKAWSILLLKALQAGHRIKIIHAIDRDLNEMYETINKWIPMYLMGGVEPYYCPKLRDGILRRTVFIAPASAAILSDSIQDCTEGMLNIYINSKAAVSALVSEFNNYLMICKPLLNIYNKNDSVKFHHTFNELQSQTIPTVCFSQTLSIMTMPEETVKMIAERTECEELYLSWETKYHYFFDTIKRCTFNDIIRLPEITKVFSGDIPVIDFEISSLHDIFYNSKDFCRHLKNIIYLLENYLNYNVTIADEGIYDSWVYTKEEKGVVLGYAYDRESAMMVTEASMTRAFWNYLYKQTNGETLEQREAVIYKLKLYIKKLEDMKPIEV